MIQTWRFYDAETGVFQRGSFSSTVQADVDANTPAGHVATTIAADPLTQRMDLETGQLVPYTPPAPVVMWDGPTARAERDRLLADCDWVVTRAFETTTPVPPPWAAYRAALRNLPQQPGFPDAITWPVPPT